MAKTFDATLKDLIAQYPRDWLHLLRLDTPVRCSGFCGQSSCLFLR
jgi:hypothetical protein